MSVAIFLVLCIAGISGIFIGLLDVVNLLKKERKIRRYRKSRCAEEMIKKEVMKLKRLRKVIVTQSLFKMIMGTLFLLMAFGVI
ncbi:hypothetical protein J7J39_00625 [bacterium]|nr:hypothetical protein [bacterium]